MPIPKSNSGEMPFLDHLEELRWRIIYSLLALGRRGRSRLLAALSVRRRRPSRAADPPADPRAQARVPPSERRLHHHPQHGDDVRLRARVAGHPLSGLGVPRAGAQASTRGASGSGCCSAAWSCSSAGAALAYFVVVPLALPWLFSFGGPSLVPLITAEDYFSFIFAMVLTFGVSFELPIVILALATLGIVTPAVPDEVPSPRHRAHRHRRRVPDARRHGLDDDRAVGSALRTLRAERARGVRDLPPQDAPSRDDGRSAARRIARVIRAAIAGAILVASAAGSIHAQIIRAFQASVAETRSRFRATRPRTARGSSGRRPTASPSACSRCRATPSRAIRATRRCSTRRRTHSISSRGRRFDNRATRPNPRRNASPPSTATRSRSRATAASTTPSARTKCVSGGSYVVVPPPKSGQADIVGHGRLDYNLTLRTARITNARLPVNNGEMWYMDVALAEVMQDTSGKGRGMTVWTKGGYRSRAAPTRFPTITSSLARRSGPPTTRSSAARRSSTSRTCR